MKRERRLVYLRRGIREGFYGAIKQLSLATLILLRPHCPEDVDGYKTLREPVQGVDQGNDFGAAEEIVVDLRTAGMG